MDRDRQKRMYSPAALFRPLVWFVLLGLPAGCYYDVEDDDSSSPPVVTATPAVDHDRDGYPAEVDCDDEDPAVSPGATEACNGIDDDCDGVADNGFALDIYYWDIDGDGYGGVVAGEWCKSFDPDAILQSGDCDDSVASIHPGAEEVCNGRDDDCDGQVDEDLPVIDFYADGDGDGWGQGDPHPQCGDIDPAYSSVAGDCDDTDAGVNPDAAEQCNEIDDDCDGAVDEASDLTYVTLYRDTDGDGYGTDADALDTCLESVQGYAIEPGDCDDADAAVFPGAPDTCDGKDNDCDSEIDEDPEFLFYPDADGDGYGSDTGATAVCSPPASTAEIAGDCDDTNPDVSPAADEVLDNGIDDNCDGLVDAVVSVFVTADGSSPVAEDTIPVVTSIQEAIDMAYSGQTIAVGPGTYREHIDFHGKDVDLFSLEGPEVTIIDGEGREDDASEMDSVVLFINGESNAARIHGFTITGGKGTAGSICGYELGIGTRYGGGICTRNASPTIEGNIIEENDVWGSGGGMYLDLGSPIVRDNIVRRNSAGYDAAGINLSQAGGQVIGNVIVDNDAGRDGAGLYAFESSPLIANNIIAFNVSEDTSGSVVAPGHGAGIALYDSYPIISNNVIAYNELHEANAGGIWIVNSLAGGEINNNTIVANSALESGGGIVMFAGEVTAKNNIIAFNEAPNGANVVVNTNAPEGNLVSSYNLFYLESGLNGCVGMTPESTDLVDDPQFVNGPLDLVATDDDYRLQADSPAVDTGDPDEEYNDPDDSRADIGAFGGPRGGDFAYWSMADIAEWLE